MDPVEFFGTKAGKVWEALSNGEKTINQICEVTGLTRREVAMGLGWLAREGKISIRKPGRHHVFRLL
ncbi:MAG: hypothetical protein DRP11_00280 [Candidatus Aenigmatarchaeota archaeon]|nr:MAG: hypothetical protein DRP11_00280 [Candidatus Aenigmarchaeota archaeon]